LSPNPIPAVHKPALQTAASGTGVRGAPDAGNPRGARFAARGVGVPTTVTKIRPLSVFRTKLFVALQNARHHPRKRPNVSPIQPLIEIDQRLIIHIECMAHSAEDILDRTITSLKL
jgi:hypothetical protein